MILKGSQRAGAIDLATHLLNGFDNESVALVDIRGAVSDDLHGAFMEFEAAAAATRCKEPLYSLSLNPPIEVDRDLYYAAIDRIEQRLKLEGQPRAVVFHVKGGREHCHVVWSRILADGDHLRSVHMAHDHAKLMDLSVEFFRELEIPLPLGLEAWANKNQDRLTRPGQDYSRAEKIQSEETGITVAERRAAITEAYCGADTAIAFTAALDAAGYTLAIGDKRAFVVLDANAQIFSLARQIEGANTRDVKAKLAGIAGVPDVQKAKAILKDRAQARLDRVREAAQASINQHRQVLEIKRRLDTIISFILKLKRDLKDVEERLALKTKHKAELDAVANARSRPVRKILSSLPGLGAILRYYQFRYDLELMERHRHEREALRRKQESRTLRYDRAEFLMEKVKRRENQAVSRHALAKEMRKAMVKHRQALKEGRLSPSFGLDKKPPGMSDLEWIARVTRRQTDVAERLRRAEQKQLPRVVERRTEHSNTHNEAPDLNANNPTVHAFRENAADLAPSAQRSTGSTSKGPDERIGEAQFSVADLHPSPASTIPDKASPPKPKSTPDKIAPPKGTP